MLLDLAAREHVHSSLFGIVAIHDMTGVQFAHALQITPSIIKRLVSTWQAYPNRIRSLDYVNAPTHVNLVLNIFRRFMSKKLRQRMHVHRGDGRAIVKKVSPSVLPSELGGTEGDYESLTSELMGFTFFGVWLSWWVVGVIRMVRKSEGSLMKMSTIG